VTVATAVDAITLPYDLRVPLTVVPYQNFVACLPRKRRLPKFNAGQRLNDAAGGSVYAWHCMLAVPDAQALLLGNVALCSGL